MRYECPCGYIYDDDHEAVPFASLPDDFACPICGAPKSSFKPLDTQNTQTTESGPVPITREDYVRTLASSGSSPIVAGGATSSVIGWENILFLGAQLSRIPLFDSDDVNTRTVIGSGAARPMVIEMPLMVSHMSYGSLSAKTKVALAKGSAMARTAMGSGEGGILPEERAEAWRHIFEYVPKLYSVSDENLRDSDAIEIKVGQAAKPGMGGHLPGAKVTAEIAAMRGARLGEDIISPSHFSRLQTKDNLLDLVNELRERSGGRPIGVKIAAGHIEADLEFVVHSGADFVTIDGRGGSTGAAPQALRDSAGVPTMAALARAARFISAGNHAIDLIITGGFRLPSDAAKAIALGAKAVAFATASLTALSAPGEGEDWEKVFRFFSAANEELKMFARVCGRRDVHELCRDDLVAFGEECARITGLDRI